MLAVLRRALVLCLVLAPLSAFAFPEWQEPTPAELSMKSYAADPDAPAVYLYREETVDDALHMHSTYARIKILSEKGKDMYSDVELPYLSGYSVDSIAGRTIHSDGTVVPFTGKPYNKLLTKEGNLKVMAKVFSMPDVQVGSILEYRFKLHYADGIVASPHWLIQRRIPVIKAHYHFMPSPDRDGGSRFITAVEYGHEMIANQLLFTRILPPGDNISHDVAGRFDLTVENIPALPHGDFLPPLGNFSNRVIFYYSPFTNGAEYWSTIGKYWSKDFDHFAHVSDKIRSAVNGIVAPADTDEQKVAKIYAAVMKIDNTNFSRAHTAQENKAEGVKIKSAEDVWAQQRGSSDDITRLFVAMVRAAGLKAYGAYVVNRDTNVFDQSYLYWGQLDDEVAIVSINGKEVYFDPGQRYCEFAKLHWKHTWAGGIRQTADDTQIFTTPGEAYTDNIVTRNAELTLDPNGQVHGRIYVNMTGVQALRWRQAALRSDETAIKKDFDKEFQGSMPPGIAVKTDHFIGLADYGHALMAAVDVTGTLGNQTGKHIFIPAVFFEAGDSPLFAQTKREYPVYIHYPYTISDHLKLTLPPNLTVESTPKPAFINYSPNADYVVNFGSKPQIFEYARRLRLSNTLYKATEYPGLRDFFQKVSSDDQAQFAVKVAPVAVSASAPVQAAAPAGGK